MKLLHIQTQKFHEAEILHLQEEDYDKIAKSKQFEFDWRKERIKYKVYKIFRIEDKEQILGLISMIDIPQELRVQINLIELSKQNVGKDKTYGRIAGCLLAYACERSFEQSFGGFVSLIPKTKLIDHYCSEYGFRRFGRELALDYEESLALIQTYRS